jgi:hypothetical protein
MKPNFIVIGSMKSGTTTLCDLLGRHPDVFMCNPKEPNFFCRMDIYARGFDWYESLFEDAAGKTAIGEGSTSYTKAHIFPGVPERIASHLPDAKLIYIVRHPLERRESQWMFNVINNKVHQSFDKTLRNEPHLINTSRYWWQLSKFREHFADTQIKVLFFEELKQHPDALLRDCFDFLGVAPESYTGNTAEKKNVTREFEMERNTLSLARKIPGYHALKNLVPASLKEALQPLLKKQVTGHPEWNPKLRREVIRELEPDIHRFLDFCGKPGDYWILDEKL